MKHLSNDQYVNGHILCDEEGDEISPFGFEGKSMEIETTT